MTKLRKLAALLCAVLAGGGLCDAQSVLTLEEIFESAEKSSMQLRPLSTAVDVARREEGVARSARLPEVDLTLSLSYLGDGFTTKRNFTDYAKAPIPHLGNGLSLNVQQPIYAGGAISGAIEMAALKTTAARYAEEMKRDNIRFALTGFYLDIYKYSNLRLVVLENLSAANKVLAEMTARYEHGTALKNDITRYELLVSNLELELIRIDNTLKILNSNLVSLAGLPGNTVVVPDSTILMRSLPSDGEQWWQSEAEKSAPALALARMGVDISRKAERLVKAESLPKVGLQAGWSMDGPILVEVPPINRNLSYWYVGVGISYNIGSLYKNNKAQAKSRMATRLAIEELDAARENISLEVRADHIRYLEAFEELKTRSKALELADRNYATTSTRFSADMALITDMLDAANSRLDAGQQLVNAKINIIYFYYKLLFISGKI